MKHWSELLTAFNLTLSEYKVETVGKKYNRDHGENSSCWGFKLNLLWHVYKKILHPFSENNKPPKADAGPDKELTLPVDSTTLDGSKSSDDQKIVSFLWEKTRYVASSGLFLRKYLGLSFKTRHTPTYLPCVKSWSHWAW